MVGKGRRTMKRDNSIDILKGLGILLVLFGHTAVPHEVSLWIYGFHMPLFFFASGYFSKCNSFWYSLRKNCKSILVPWLFMFLCYSLMNIGVSILHSGDVLSSLLVLGDRYNLLDEDSLWYPTIWFLVCLFMLKTIDALMWCATMRTSIRLALGGVIYVVSQYVELPFFIDTAMAMFFFYEIGRIFHAREWNLRQAHWAIPLIVVSLYSVFIHTVLPAVDIKHNDYQIYLPLMALPVIWAFYQLSKIIETEAGPIMKNTLSHLGRSSLVLFGLHQPLWIVMFPMASRFPYTWLQPIFMVLPTIPMLLFTEKIVFRYSPILLGKESLTTINDDKTT